MMLINEEGGQVLETSAVDALMRIFGYYRQNNTVHDIDASSPPDEASASVFEKLDAVVQT